MKRRGLLGAGAAFVAAGAARAAERLRHVGLLTLRAGPNEYDAAFRDGLRALGYVEGRTLRIDERWAAGSERRAEELAAELVAAGVEVLVVATTAATRAAQRASTRVPIVMAASADPVVAGLVASYARPGGNLTGLSMVSTDTAAKRLQLLRELLPEAKQVGVLMFGGREEPGNARLVDELRAAAQRLALTLATASVRGPGDLAEAFAALAQERAQALVVQANAVTIDHRARVAELAEQQRLPALYETESFVEAGGLMSYGPSLAEMYRRAAFYVHRILEGARPQDLPIELPDRYELVVNLKAARALGLRLPPAIMVRVSRVVE